MEQRQFFLRDILTVVFKHLRLIILFPIALFVIVFALNYIWPPSYESEAQVRIVKGREIVQSDVTVTQTASDVTMNALSAEDLNSEIVLLHSRDLLEDVVTGMKLHENSAFPYGTSPARAPYYLVRSTLLTILDLLGLREKPNEIEEAMQHLDKAIIAEPIRDSWVLSVRVRLGDRELAQQVLEEVLKAFQTLHIRVFKAPDSAAFFTAQRERIGERLAEAEKKLREFRDQNNISLLEAEEELILEQYTEAQRLLTQLAQTKTALESMETGGDTAVAALSTQTESTVVREMQLRLLELILERNRVVQSLGPAHPTVQSLKSQVAAAQADLEAAIEETRKITESKVATIQERREQLNATKDTVSALEKEMERLTEDYDLYAGKVEESVIADKLAEDRVTSVRVASNPSLPVNPVTPNRLLNLAVALIGGLIAALALAFLFDYFDHGLKTPEDVDYFVKVPVLASFFNKPGQALDRRQGDRLATMVDSLPGVSGGVLEVASSVPDEDAAAVALLMAESFANNPDGKTLLVDLTNQIGRPKTATHGIVDVLMGQASPSQVFTGPDKLTIIGRGTGEYPAYLWGSDRMRALLDDLRGQFRYIVFAAGPVLVSDDAITLAKLADGVILTIKADSTRREVVNRAVGMLKDSNARVHGAVLTRRTQSIPNAVYRKI